MGTDRRAAGLSHHYKTALARLDASHHNTPAGRTGPLVRRLQSYGKLEGLVVGPWGEGSKDLHSLVKVLAETKLAAKARSLGRQMSDKELGVIVNQVRKYLSTSFIRAQSLCLINRLSFLGEGAQAAAGRRIVARQLEEGRRRERQASYMAHIRGRGLSREGQIFV